MGVTIASVMDDDNDDGNDNADDEDDDNVDGLGGRDVGKLASLSLSSAHKRISKVFTAQRQY